MPKSNDKCSSATILWPFIFVQCQASKFMNLQQAVIATKKQTLFQNQLSISEYIQREDVVNSYSVRIW